MDKNIATLVAYEKENDLKSEIEVRSVHTLTINGRDLAVGNVRVIAVLPNGDGTSAVVLYWETTKPADSQIVFSKKGIVSPYNAFMYNLGYQFASIRFPWPTTNHYMYIPRMQDGTEYVYRVRSVTESGSMITGGDYTLNIGNTGIPVINL